ncbi:type IV secretion system protein [Acidocella sp.]|uniref:type IV secretion system protein n=1 Tax=Acidocella sp. TaxID=50710 RepID=UPI00261A8FED|nr:type IV secretion system protein [Acidocella sp.]MDD2794677.1 type IV secretion system protein [Acidocella sp.]
MRKILAVMAVLGAVLALTPNAKAQIPVIDSANLTQSIQELAQDVATVEQLKNQLTQLQQTYAMFTKPTNVLGMATNLENSTLENPMPAANALAGLTGGQTAPSGAGVTFYNQNHIYTPTTGSTDTTQLTANAQGIANIEGIASTNLAAIQTRLQELPNLESDLNAASSITQVNAINGRIAAESQFVQAQQAQATNLQVLASEQQASHLQQQQEAHQQSDADYLAALNSASP